MTDTDTTEAEQHETDANDHERLDRVETKLDALIETVNRIIPGSHAEAEERTERRLDRGSAVAEEVKAELAKAKEEEARRKAADDEQSERQQIREDLAKLKETPPAQPVPRRTKLLGWGDGR
jgi:hypothetical protein